MSGNVVQSAQECWDSLVAAGVLRPQDYDADLVDELRSRFAFDESKDFRVAIDALSAQELIENLFEVLEPVVVMLSDLLRLYEAIQATRASGPNLRVRFNFDRDVRPFEFDIEVFRDWEETSRRVLVARRYPRWKAGAAWGLRSAIAQGLLILSPDVDRPVGRNRSMAWPPAQAAPVSGIDQLDSRIARAWQMREQFLAEASAQWPARSDYSDGFQGPDGLGNLASLVSDFWDYAIGEELTWLADRGATALALGGATVRLATAVAEVTREMDAALEELPTVGRLIRENVNELTSLLSLPIWGKRHEVYSAWIFTRIVDAIGQRRLDFKVTSGRLSFDFGGVELATFDSVDGPIAVWTELRTAYGTPIGHGRTGGVQPDFRLVREPIDEPGSSTLAVEVKQYRRSVLRNPADALADYTGGLPQAHVVLAAYGPVSKKVLDRLEPGARSRATVVRHLRPGNSDQLEEFRAVIAAHIPDEPTPSERPNASDYASSWTRDGDVRVELAWDDPAVDLDLHARLPGAHAVCHSNLAAFTASGHVVLERDVLRGGGDPEILHVAGLEVVAVHVNAYSSHALSDVDASIRIVSGAIDETIRWVGAHDDDGARWRHVMNIYPDRVEMVVDHSLNRP